ncbi:MAG: (2Fe-2S)-binding protein [Deltaproteobacteria bacterium]|nr:(2Fe-2S)-binding protein [Deltaproteobacteria bacterium]
MIVCSCLGLSERRIRADIESGARTLDELARGCGAGRDCGACVLDLADILAGSANGSPTRPANPPHEPRTEAQRGFP